MQELLQQLKQRAEVILASIPNNYRINLIIAVDDPVAHSGHQRPGDFWVCLDDGSGNKLLHR